MCSTPKGHYRPRSLCEAFYRGRGILRVPALPSASVSLMTWSGSVWWDDGQYPHIHRLHNSHKAPSEFQTLCFWYQTVCKYLWVETHLVCDSSTKQQQLSTEGEWTETFIHSIPSIHISEYRQAASDKATFNFSGCLPNLGIQNIPLCWAADTALVVGCLIH